MEDDRLYIQTELCTGTLSSEMSKNPLPMDRRYKLLREICLALSFIHRNNMVHLDIKPENIFIKNDQFKLGDFGLVNKATCDQEVEEGDSRYMSMELLSGDCADLTKSDIFSLGATMYEICRGEPLPMNGQEWQDIRAGHLLPFPDDTESDLVSLVVEMMHPSPHLRPTAVDLLSRPKLLSDEEKALNAEKTKVRQLAAQALCFRHFSPPPRKGLTRANTWNGTLPLPH
jgi:wee1-like protein kinase